jgi:four helix bundle protein
MSHGQESRRRRFGPLPTRLRFWYSWSTLNFRKLEVWDKAHDLVLAVYRLADDLPRSERYGIASQMQRSATSIPANIAEGAGRGSDRDHARLISIAIGSSNELDDQLQLSQDLGMARGTEVEAIHGQVVEVRRMLLALRRRLRGS